MAETGCVRDLAVQNLDVAGSLQLTSASSRLNFKQNVITPGGARTLTVDESGSLVIVAGNDNILLPNITANDIGTTFTFIYPVASANAAIVRTGGAAALSDDFVPGFVPCINTADVSASAFIGGVPVADNDNTFTFDSDAANGITLAGSVLTCTAIAASAVGANVWLCGGTLISSDQDSTGAAYFTPV